MEIISPVKRVSLRCFLPSMRTPDAAQLNFAMYGSHFERDVLVCIVFELTIGRSILGIMFSNLAQYISNCISSRY